MTTPRERSLRSRSRRGPGSTVRRVASLATVAVLTAALVSAAGPATGDEVRTDTTLGGYSVSVNAAPFKVLLDDPGIPIPRPEGGAIVEADPAYSEAALDSGPTSRGLGAVLWPGGLFGEGLPQVAQGAPQWPLKAEARYPDKPYVATAQDNGAFMKGQALGLDVLGTARMNPQDVPGALDLGTVASTSTATVKDGVAIGTGASQVSDVTLLGGVIKVGSVSTALRVTSDGKKPASSGSTVVSGLTVGGVGYVVDDKGARPVGAPVNQGSGPLPVGSALDPAKQLGITISGLAQDQSKDADSATRDAKGLRITVDTVVLRGVLNQTPPQLMDPIYMLISQLPKDQQGNFYYLLSATPKITFILGAGTAMAAATQPLSFSFPPPTFGGLPVGLPGGSVVPPAASGGAAAPAIGPGTTTGSGPVPPPAVDPRTLPRTVAAAHSSSPFGGLPPSLLLLVAALAGGAGWALLRLQGAAMALGAAAGPCTDGSTSSLPDLRGA